MREMAELEKRTTSAKAFAYMVNVNRDIRYKSTTISQTQINVVSHDYAEVMPFDLQDGRYFTALESQSGRNVVIIGADIAETFFVNEDPIGKSIKIFGLKLDVIGVIKKKGQDIFGNSDDDKVIIPVNFARNLIDLRNIGSAIVVRAKPGVSNEELKDELIGAMRAVRKLKPTVEDNFAINQMDIVNKSFDQLFGVIAVVGWIIGGFSLLVGGFGIANIMFVSVKERTSQIGIQKSLGAKNYFILLQFLFEAVFLSVLGGIVGLIIVLIMSMLVTQLSSFNLVLSLQNILLGVFVSAFIGLVSGFLPAWSASKLDPVEAMRSTF